MDEPEKSVFDSMFSYGQFAEQVRRGRRYVWEKEVQEFLDTVLATLKERDVTLEIGTLLYRAQLGVRPVEEDNEGQPHGPYAFHPERMKPLKYGAIEGRANPSGIPVLYLATSIETAISEVRPWIGSEVSVSQFKIVRDLKIFDLSKGYGKWNSGPIEFFDLRAPDATDKELAVWIDIDNAFSRPVEYSDNTTEYVPTQILAELFRGAGYDGLVYRSHFGEEGYNVALFDTRSAEAINGTPYQVKGMDVKFDQMGDTWHSRR